MLRWPLLLAAVLVASCAAPAPTPKAVATLRMSGPYPNAAVQVNGKPLVLLVDLGGVYALFLTTEEMTKAGIRTITGQTRFADVAGNVFLSRKFNAETVQLSGLELGALSGAEAVGPLPPAGNGSIGREALAGHLLVFDYEQRELRLYIAGDAAAMNRECGATRFSLDDDGSVLSTTVATEIGSLRMGWDTGFPFNAIQERRVPSAMKREPAPGGPDRVSVGRLFANGAVLPPQTMAVVTFSGPAVDGFFGFDTFKCAKVCLDATARVGAIQPYGQ
jgi:hypothetical protein